MAHASPLAVMPRAHLEIEADETPLFANRVASERAGLALVDRISTFEDIVGSSDALKKALGQVKKVAPTDSTTLILGETGTGKELIARAIHRQAHRSGRAFIRVNCGAIPESLIAS